MFTLAEVNRDLRALRRLFRTNGIRNNLIESINTRALKSGRRQTGVFPSNRNSRWTLIFQHPKHGTDPQYGTEIDCKIINIKLLLWILQR